MSRRRRSKTFSLPAAEPNTPLPADFSTVCPSCGKRLDEHDQAEQNSDGTMTIHDKAQPSPGDFALCLACGEPARFGANGHLRRLTPDDDTDITPQLRLTLLRIQAARVSVLFSYKERGETWMGTKL